MAGIGGVQDPSDRAVVHTDSGSDSVQRISIAVGRQDRLDRLDRLPGRLGGNQLSGELRGRGARGARRDCSRAGRVRRRGPRPHVDLAVTRLGAALRGAGGVAPEAAFWVALRVRRAGLSPIATSAVVATATATSMTSGRTAAKVGAIPASTAKSRNATKLKTNAPTARAAVAATDARYMAPEGLALTNTAIP
jgi:hypothetical protein